MFQVQINIDDLHRFCSENCRDSDGFNFQKQLNEKEKEKIDDLIDKFEALLEDRLISFACYSDLIHDLQFEYSSFFQTQTNNNNNNSSKKLNKKT